MITITLCNDWLSSKEMINRLKSNWKAFTKTLLVGWSLEAKKNIVRNIELGGSLFGSNFDPNHPMTELLKGSNQPLIDKRELINNISYQFTGDFSAFVGIRIGSGTTEHGLDLATVASLQEEGYVIQVTDKMRAYLHLIGFHISSSTTVLYVPPRPHMSPIVYDNKFIEIMGFIFEQTFFNFFFRG